MKRRMNETHHCSTGCRCLLVAFIWMALLWLGMCVGTAEIEQPEEDVQFRFEEFILEDHGDNTCTIIGYEGEQQELEIPAWLEGRQVVAIGKSAFAQCTQLKKVTIPAGIKRIEECAFIFCENLKVVSIPEGVEYIESGAFGHCNNLEDVELPDSVISVERAFHDCRRLIKRSQDYEIVAFSNDVCIIKVYLGKEKIVHIPEQLDGKTVVGIGQYAFMGHKDIAEIHMPDSIRLIDRWAFYQCSNLVHVTLPKGLNNLATSAFGECRKIEKLDLPDGLRTIGPNAFSSMEALKEITIPDGVTEIGSNVFRFCKSLTSIEIPPSVTRLEDGTFGDCYSLQKITVPPTVTYFGSDVFFWCENLCEIWGEPGSAAEKYAKESGRLFISTLKADSTTQKNEDKVYPAGTRIIGDYKIMAYADGTCGIMDYYGGDKEMVIPEYVGDYRVVEICGTNRFGLYNGVTIVVIPEGVERIGKYAFLGCDFSEMSIPDSAVAIDRSFLDLCDELASVHISPDHPVLEWKNDCLIYKEDQVLILFCGDQSYFQVPDGIVTIGEDAFCGKENLQNVRIPGSVRSIEYGAFSFCTNLESVSIAEGVQKIGDQAFSSCYSLKKINFPRSLIELGKEVFHVSDELESITTPYGAISTEDLEIKDTSPLYPRFNQIFLKGPDTLEVYSGPGEDYYRNADGKAMLATSGDVYCAGCEGDWLWVLYESNEGIAKIGYAQNPIPSTVYEFSKLSFSYQNATVISDCDLQDIPVAGGKVIRKMMIGDSITHLESFQDIPLHTRKDPNIETWAYIETTVDNEKVRGYIPYEAIQISETD